MKIHMHEVRKVIYGKSVIVKQLFSSIILLYDEMCNQKCDRLSVSLNLIEFVIIRIVELFTLNFM